MKRGSKMSRAQRKAHRALGGGAKNKYQTTGRDLTSETRALFSLNFKIKMLQIYTTELKHARNGLALTIPELLTDNDYESGDLKRVTINVND